MAPAAIAPLIGFLLGVMMGIKKELPVMGVLLFGVFGAGIFFGITFLLTLHAAGEL